MAETKVYGNGWVATVLITDPPADIYHAYVTTIGDTAALALSGAKFVTEIFTQGRTSYIRVAPEVASDTDFDTKITRHQGISRFSFKLEAGDRLDEKPNSGVSAD